MENNSGGKPVLHEEQLNACIEFLKKCNNGRFIAIMQLILDGRFRDEEDVFILFTEANKKNILISNGMYTKIIGALYMLLQRFSQAKIDQDSATDKITNMEE